MGSSYASWQVNREKVYRRIDEASRRAFEDESDLVPRAMAYGEYTSRPFYGSGRMMVLRRFSLTVTTSIAWLFLIII